MAADGGLKIPVVVTALGVNASSLPAVFSQAYQYYVLSQSTDFVNVAGKANEAGQGAYDAQVKNDEQDVELEDHEQRITANTAAIGLLEVRLTTAEGKIVVLRSDVDYLLDEVIDIQAELVTVDGRLDTAESDIDNLQADYVSKSAIANQIVQAGGGSLIAGTVATPTADKFQVGGSINISGVYKVNGTQVLTARQTGWTAATGTSFKGTFNADLAWTIGALNVLQIQQIADALTEVRKRTKAIDDVLRTHGLIN